MYSPVWCHGRVHPLQVRTLTDDKGNPWFVAADVCKVLELGWDKTNGIHAPSRVVKYLDEDERSSKKIARGAPASIIISESGLNKLIMRSNKPQAKKFQNWVTQVVLPAIRKDGM